MSLQDYLRKIQEAGFRFPSIPVYTSHRYAYAKTAEQLRKLFDMRTRTEKKERTLWDFTVLPNTSLSVTEGQEWLGSSAADMDRLVFEGWLTYRSGLFLHSLIKEIVFLRAKDEKAPKGTMQKLAGYFAEGWLLHDCTPYSAVLCA